MCKTCFVFFFLHTLWVGHNINTARDRRYLEDKKKLVTYIYTEILGFEIQEEAKSGEPYLSQNTAIFSNNPHNTVTLVAHAKRINSLKINVSTQCNQ